MQLKGIVQFFQQAVAKRQRIIRLRIDLSSNSIPLHSPVGLLGKPWCSIKPTQTYQTYHISKHPLAVIENRKLNV